MFHIIVVTHGHLAAALLESAAMISGAVPDSVKAVCLSLEDNLESARAKIKAFLKSDDLLGEAAPALILVDLMGGTAANAAAWALQSNQLEIIAGVNLPMVLEVLLNKESLSLVEAAQVAKKAGIQSIIDVRTSLLDATIAATSD